MEIAAFKLVFMSAMSTWFTALLLGYLLHTFFTNGFK